MRRTSVLSRRNTPARTRPRRYAGSTASLLAVVARPPRKKRTKKMNLTSGSLTCVAPRRVNNRLCPARHEPEDDQRHDHKQQEPDIIVRKQHAQREHRPEISNETRSKNHFAHGSIAESALDHDGVNDRDRCCRKRDSCDLRLVQRPAKNELRNKPNEAEWDSKRKHSDQNAPPPIGLQRNWIDFCSSEKGEHATAKQGEKVGPLR